MGDLNFVQGKRRAGLRAEPLGYNLHENIKPMKQPREPTPDSDINGPPIGSSDDESEAQDDMLSAKSSTPADKAVAPVITKAGSAVNGSSSIDICSSPPNEIDVEPLKTRATKNFSSGESYTSPKRQFDATDVRASSEEDITSPFNMTYKRRKTDWTRRKTITNIHTSKPLAKSAKNSGRASIPARGGMNTNKGFRNPETEALLSQVDQIKQQETKKASFKPPPKYDNSPRSVRASSRLSRHSPGNSIDELSHNFKIPTTISSPKATKKKDELGQKFVVPSVLPDDGATPRTTRSKKLFKKPEILTSTGALHTNDMTDLIETTRAKLDILTALPSSSMTVSSLPSTSNDVDSPLSSPISPPLSSPETDALIRDVPFDTPKAPVFRQPTIIAKCPICRENVDRSFLEGFDSGTERLTVREQARFCKEHNARSAETEWEEKGYPTIDWLHLDKRLANFHAALGDILKGRQKSYYRNFFEDQLKDRQSRIVQHSLTSGVGIEGLEPGYYGSRGAKIMTENIISHFAPQLRRLATSDKLVSSRGVAGYVQAVLMPELANLLVRDDMGVDEEGARAVIRDSVKVGRLLCEEEDEFIYYNEEDELVG